MKLWWSFQFNHSVGNDHNHCSRSMHYIHQTIDECYESETYLNANKEELPISNFHQSLFEKGTSCVHAGQPQVRLNFFLLLFSSKCTISLVWATSKGPAITTEDIHDLKHVHTQLNKDGGQCLASRTTSVLWAFRLHFKSLCCAEHWTPSSWKCITSASTGYSINIAVWGSVRFCCL